MRLNRSIGFAVGSYVVALGCSVGSGEDHEPTDGEALPVVIDNSSEQASEAEMVVGSYAAGELALGAGFVDLLAQTGDSWKVVSAGGREQPLDLGSPAIAIAEPLQSGDEIDLVSESTGDATTTLRVRIASASGVLGPALEPASTSAGCTPLCIKEYPADIFPASACGACGWDKRKYDGRTRECSRCGVMCGDRFYAVTFGCGAWQTFTSWCDSC